MQDVSNPLAYRQFPWCRCDNDLVYNPLRLAYGGFGPAANLGTFWQFYVTLVPVTPPASPTPCSTSDLYKAEFNVGAWLRGASHAHNAGLVRKTLTSGRQH